MKWKEKTIKQVFIILVPIFGSLKKFLIDNSGEFINWEFCSLCENVNICILTTAAELLWRNSLIERHNAIVGYTVTKTILDACCDLELALSSTVAANNYQKYINGFCPNQLVSKGNSNYPTALNSKLSALEGQLSSEVGANNINAIDTARQAFIQSESSDRIRHALQYQSRTSGDVHYFTGDMVYYR